MDEYEVPAEEAAKERDEVMQATIERKNRWPSMTYEQGVEAALAWVLGDREERPYTEE